MTGKLLPPAAATAAAAASKSNGAALVIENAPQPRPQKQLPSPSPAPNSTSSAPSAPSGGIPTNKLKRLAFSQKGMSNIKLDDGDTASTASTAPTLLSSTSSGGGFWSLSESSITFDSASSFRPSAAAAAAAAGGGSPNARHRLNLNRSNASGGGNCAALQRSRSKSAPRPRSPGKNGGAFRRVARERSAQAQAQAQAQAHNREQKQHHNQVQVHGSRRQHGGPRRPLVNARVNAAQARQKVPQKPEVAAAAAAAAAAAGGASVGQAACNRAAAAPPPAGRPGPAAGSATAAAAAAAAGPRRVERAHLPKRPHPDLKNSRPRSQSQVRPRPLPGQAIPPSMTTATTSTTSTSAQTPPPSAPSASRPQYQHHPQPRGRVSSAHHDADALSFKDFYRISHEIDRGTFARVYEAYHRYTAVRYAVKVIDRRSLSRKADDAVFREARILQELQNKQRSPEGVEDSASCGFVRLVDFFIEPTRFFLVMDYMAGGPVFDRVLDRHFYTEEDARQLATKILKAVAFMHRHDVVHRDLKPQNILLVSGESDTNVKIADFGFATMIRPLMDEKTGKMTRRVLRQKCGTPSYVAPEVISGQGYDQGADMWSLGVIFFFVLGGYPPFVDYNSRQGMFQKIMAGEYEFHETDWSGVSTQAKDFIKALLTVDPSKRLTASQALYHPWILAGSSSSTGTSSKITSSSKPMSSSSPSKPPKDAASSHHKKTDKVKNKGMKKLKAAFGGGGGGSKQPSSSKHHHHLGERADNRRRTASPVQ